MVLAATPGAGPLAPLLPSAQAAQNSQDSSNDRKSICISRPLRPQDIIHTGEHGFSNELSRFYSPAESLAADRLVELKLRLRSVKGNSFWTTATEAIANMLGAQYAFISKRMNFDEEDPNVILPPIGEPESCLLGMSIYYSGGQADTFNASRAKYIAHNCPCAHMKHNKVLLIPEKLSKVIPNNPNALPEQPEGYLAVPLSLDAYNTQVFGHFGVMWTQKGLDERSCSFGFLEMLLHGIERLIVEQFVEQRLVPISAQSSQNVPILAQPPDSPKTYTSFSTSLKPYARSLSHELRTPMQGVVGMLDVMFAQVQEAGEGQNNQKAHQLFASLKESIEIVQDSARRAVEAADNIVHAYDMGMGVPDAPMDRHPPTNMDSPIHILDYDKRLLPTPIDSMSPTRGHKRTRSSADSPGSSNPSKSRRISLSKSKGDSRDSDSMQKSDEPTPQDTPSAAQHLIERNIAPGVRQMDIRDAFQGLVNDMLRIGGRPESAIAQPIDGGEEIEIRRRFANGEEKVQQIRWSVDDAVPDTIIVDEQSFAGLISRVFHNALKFTDAGRITINVRLSQKGTSLLIGVEDTGIGIPSAFVPRLFKPFSKEDDGITRSSEGLGLGLMVAKGLARKLNGDLLVVRSETEGPHKGTDFQIRIPLMPTESISRPVTPLGSRSPSLRLRSTEEEGRLHSAKSQTPPVLHRPSGTRHSRSSSNVTRFNIVSNCVQPTNLSPYHLYQPPSLTSEARVTALEVHSQLVPPPDVISPPTSVSTEQANVPSILRTTGCVPTPLPGSDMAIPQPVTKLANRLPLSLMVVEDNHINRRILVQMLKDMGYEHILQAYDGAEAVRQMDRHLKQLQCGEVDYEIDVILMDIWMPIMNGYEATEKILGMFDASHDSSAYKAPVVLAVTADVTDEATGNLANSGMQGPLTKPYKMKELERYLLELLS